MDPTEAFGEPSVNKRLTDPDLKETDTHSWAGHHSVGRVEYYTVRKSLVVHSCYLGTQETEAGGLWAWGYRMRG